MSISLYGAHKIDFSTIVKSDSDLFIVGLNNESRSSVILSILNENEIYDKKIIIQTHVPDMDLMEFEKNFQDINFVDATKNVSILKRIPEYSNIIGGYGDTINSVAIDMTGLPIPDIFVILMIVSKKYPDCKIKVYYSEPYNYYYEKYLFKNYKYSLGELDVIEVPGYNGTFHRNKDNIMVFILGFEDKVSRHLYLHDEPNKIVAINGFPTSIQKFKDISVINNGILREVNFEKLYYSDALNPFELYNTLDKVVKEYGDANYTVVPLGSKPMALGAGLFQLSNRNIKLKYPIPESYSYNSIQNTMDAIWEYDIDKWR